jgi:hypothetical protein
MYVACCTLYLLLLLPLLLMLVVREMGGYGVKFNCGTSHPGPTSHTFSPAVSAAAGDARDGPRVWHLAG